MLVSHGWFLVMIVVIPLAVITLLGTRTWAKMTPNSFECRKCHREFRRPAWKRFPRACPHCGVRDWHSA